MATIGTPERVARLYDYLIHPRLYKRNGGTLPIDQEIIDELEERQVLQHQNVEKPSYNFKVTPTQLLIGNFKTFC